MARTAEQYTKIKYTGQPTRAQFDLSQPKTPAIRTQKKSRYHGQGAIGSVPRTQFYLASSGDYTPEALRQIYQTPTTLASAEELDLSPGAIGGDYARGDNQLRIMENLPPRWGNYIARHEYGHMFDVDRPPDSEPRYHSDFNSFKQDFNAANTFMPYAAGRNDVQEARATVAAEPWMFKGVQQHFPEFQARAWQKPGRGSQLNFAMPQFVGRRLMGDLVDAYNMLRASNQLRELSALSRATPQPKQ